MVTNGVPGYWLALGTIEGRLLDQHGRVGRPHKIGEDLKAILYSLQYEPGKDEPVNSAPRYPGVPRQVSAATW